MEFDIWNVCVCVFEYKDIFMFISDSSIEILVANGFDQVYYIHHSLHSIYSSVWHLTGIHTTVV